MDSSVNPNAFMAASKSASNQDSFLFPTSFSDALSVLTNNPRQGNEDTAVNIGFELLSCSEDFLSQQRPMTEPVFSQSQPDTGHDSLSFSQASSSQQQPTAEPIPSRSQQNTDLSLYPQAGLSQQPTTSEPAQSQPGTELDFSLFLQDNLFQQQPTCEPALSQPQSDTGLGFWPFPEDNVLHQQHTGEPILSQSQPNAGLNYSSFPEVNLLQKQSTSEPILPQLHSNTIDPAFTTLTNQNETHNFNFFDMAPPPDLLDYRILQLPEQLETKKPKLNLLLQPTFTRPDDMANIIPAFSFEQTAPIFGEFEKPELTFTMQANQAAHVNNSSNFQDLTPKVCQSETQALPDGQSTEFNPSHRRPRNAPFSRRAPPEVAEEDILDAMRAAPSQRDGDKVKQGRIVKKQTKRGKRCAKKLSHCDTLLAVPNS